MISVMLGDITTLDVDAIVNAANNELKGGGGVDGAIHRAAGPDVMKECRKIGYCPTGDAVVTTAGKLNAKGIIHTVGPIWTGGESGEDDLLASCYRRSLEVAVANGWRTVAFPNISTGVYRFPKKRAARIAWKTVHTFLSETSAIEKVIFVCFDEENYQYYQQLQTD